jgi:3-carboxy-cis,cis-muconate cycloisomerase
MFDELFSAPDVVAATSEQAWVEAMLEVERALTRAGAGAGLIPDEAAEAILAACRPGLVDAADVWRAAVESATPVIPLVEALRGAVPSEHRQYVHLGATSQDIVDTAMMLVASRAVGHILADLLGCGERIEELGREHADAPQLGRTLLQPARPTTFGAVAGGWSAAVRSAHEGLRRWRPAVQLGCPVGSRVEFGAHGDAVAAQIAAQLGLEAVPAWHTDRTRVVELASALGACAGVLAKIAGDVILLSQAEIAELTFTGGGRSSAMPGKRNPARAVLVVAAAHRAPGLIATLFAAMPQELQRAAGRWQAEWPALADLLRVAGGAAHHARAMLAGLRVDAERMASRT